MSNFELGYALSAEEHAPNDLVRNTRRAEEAGFTFALISDHYHPWVDAQGHAAFVWSVLGGIATATERIRLGTGVTCPMIRTHPAIIAQAAATTACMFGDGRFFLGVGSGENLNEHILGDHWPAPDERLEMLEESVEVMRLLWQGGYQTHRGKHYTVENARIYDVPDGGVPVYVAASAPNAAELAGRIGDGFISVAPEEELVERFEGSGGKGKEKIGQVMACYAASEQEAKKIVKEIWPNGSIKGDLSQELPLPKHFEQAAEMVSEDEVCEGVACGPDPEVHLTQIREMADAGFTHVYVHQIGHEQEEFFRFYEREIIPKV
jgi:coenzyme F420-dependent glucose-6-phosphate dehydrogenase